MSTNIISTIAGTGVAGCSGDGGPATSAAIAYPHGIDFDSAGNVYFGDYEGCNVIRKITVSTGIISTVAGNFDQGYSGDNVQATATSLFYPHDVALDDYDNIFICDTVNNRIRKVTVSIGVMTTVVGTGEASSTGDGDAATSATINSPRHCRFDSSGNFYISEHHGNRIRKIANFVAVSPTVAPSPSYTPTTAPSYSSGTITTIAGTGSEGYSGDDGDATSATFYNPHGIAIDSSGNVYVNDYRNHRVRKISSSTGIISTYAGTGVGGFSGDGGVATNAALNGPNGMCIDTSDNIYISDLGNNRIRKIASSTTMIFTIAGTGAGSFSGDNGPATSATIDEVRGVAVDTSGKEQ